MKKISTIAAEAVSVSDPDFSTPHEVGEILRIGENSVYSLLKDAPFPVLRISRQIIRIPREPFMEWAGL
jgi:hypothetical protein